MERILKSDTMQDIKVVVESRSNGLITSDSASKNSLMDKILLKSNGSFLWTVLVLRELSTAYSEEQVNGVLENVPLGMKPLYHRTLDLMGATGRGKRLAKAILTWEIGRAHV